MPGTNPLNFEQIRAILNNPRSFDSPRDRMIFLTQLYTGLRGAEGCDIRVNQVCSINKKGEIEIFPILNMNPDQMKGKARGRDIHLPEPLKDALKIYLKNYSEIFKIKLTTSTFVLPLTDQELYRENCKRYKNKLSQLVPGTTREYFLKLFPTQKCDGKKGLISISRASWGDILKEVFNRNGIVGAKRTIGTHSLRKTYIRDLYNSEEMKKDPLLLIRCTGHARLETLQAYVGIHDSSVEKAQLGVLSGLEENGKNEEELLLLREEIDFR